MYKIFLFTLLSLGLVPFAFSVEIKPEIVGTYGEACGAGTGQNSCEVDNGSATPNNTYKPLLMIPMGSQHVTVQDLALKDSAGGGVVVDEGDSIPSKVVVQNIDVIRSIRWGVKINDAVAGSGAIIRDSYFAFNALSFVDYKTNNWPSCINVQGGGSTDITDALIENNTVIDCAGEGISLVRAGGGIIRANRIFHARRPSIYLDNSSFTIVEHNFVVPSYGYRGGNIRSGNNPGTSSEGIKIASEGYGPGAYNSNPAKRHSYRNVVRNNIVLNARVAMNFGLQKGRAHEEGAKIGGYVYGNLFLADGEPDGNVLQAGGLINQTTIDHIEVVNNIFGGSQNCSWADFGSKEVRSNNIFIEVPAKEACRQGANTHTSVSIGFTNDRLWTADNLPDISTLIPNTLTGEGVSLNEPVIDAADYPNFANLNKGICDISQTDWEKKLHVDYNCVVRSSSPNIGALETQN